MKFSAKEALHRMTDNLDFWTALISDIPAPIIERLCGLVDFTQPPDFASFALEQHSSYSRGDLTSVWPHMVESGMLGHAVVASEFVSRDSAIELSRLAQAIDPGFDTRLLRHLLAHRIWPEEVPSTEALRTLEIVEALGVSHRHGMTLLKFVQFPHPYVQSKVAKILGQCCDSQKVIKEIYLNPDRRVRANLIEGLAFRPDLSTYMPLLKTAAMEQDVRISALALAILAERGDRLANALLRIRTLSKVAEIAAVVNYVTERVKDARAKATVAKDAELEKAKS